MTIHGIRSTLHEPLPRTQFDNLILHKQAKPVTLKQFQNPSFRKLIAKMFFTIQDIGVGLAAPQIGKSLQLAVIDIHPLPHRPNVEAYKCVLINPKIEEYSKQTYTTYEGCLSFDGLRAEVRRAKWIKATYYDEQGRLHQEKLEGFIANVFQHEIDHLNGTLFVDHLEDIKTIMTTEEFERSFANKHKK